jgi:hypothetical protein
VSFAHKKEVCHAKQQEEGKLMKTKCRGLWVCFVWLLLMVDKGGNAAESLWKVVKEPHTVAIGHTRQANSKIGGK